ncbi:MAG TPA: alpha/beta hydrolase fold domain-containing protein [Candidatus Dormibacteraeota bacterium]
MTTAAEFNAQLEKLMAVLPPPDQAPAEKTRQMRRDGTGIFPPPVYLPGARWVDTPSGVRLRVLRPASGSPRGIYIHLHGGGWTLGAADLQDPALQNLADATGLVAASIEYRLAPEHPYPAGPDDCEAAVKWLLSEGPSALDAPAWFAIGGESAGAHLAVVTLLRLRDRSAIAAANLSFGCYDMSMTPSQRQWGDRYLVLSTPVIRWFADNFLPGMDPEARRAPDVSPLYARLDGMPKALFTVGDLDPLLDDSLFMYERWRAAGSEAELALYPEAVHGFTAYPFDAAEAALARQYEFLR